MARLSRGAALAALLSTLGIISPTLALDEGYCKNYGAAAVRQSNEYFDRGCSGGPSEWWSTVAAYHGNWCVSLPADSALPAKGIIDREAVLATCRFNLGTAGRLVVHNNTDATLELSVTYPADPRLNTLPVLVGPVSRAELVIYFGESQLRALAVNVSEQPGATVPASVYSRAGREIELFPADFGVSFLTD